MSFNGTPFNDDQLDYMRSLAKVPDAQLSWCGWGRAGDPHCCCNPSSANWPDDDCECPVEGHMLGCEMDDGPLARLRRAEPGNSNDTERKGESK